MTDKYATSGGSADRCPGGAPTTASLAGVTTGEHCTVAGQLYLAEDGTRAQAAGAPTKADAARSRTTRGWTAVPAPKPEAQVAPAEKDARLLPQTKCAPAGSVTSWWAGQLACAFDASPSKAGMHACRAPAFCAQVDVECAKAGASPACPQVPENGSTVAVWAAKQGADAPAEANAALERAAAGVYKRSRAYAPGELAVACNAVHECVRPGGCPAAAPQRGAAAAGAAAGARPSCSGYPATASSDAASAGVWAAPTPTPEEEAHGIALWAAAEVAAGRPTPDAAATLLRKAA
jgi:hypothetical protein